MKTSVLFFLVFIFSASLFAQEQDNKIFKPSKDNFSIEVDFTPFNFDTPINLNGFRGRFFYNDKLAQRVGLNFDTKKNYVEYPAQLNNDDVIMFNTIDEKYFVFGISTGLEYHFLNSKRISPYIGFDFGFKSKSSNATYEDVIESYNYPNDYSYEIRKTEIKNSWQGSSYVYNPQTGYYTLTHEPIERAYTKISVNTIMGVDIYVTKHLYLGFEIGLGYNSTSKKEVEIKVDEKIENKYPKGKDNNMGFNVNNAIRLGIWL
ncbi:MAG: hypothetical protein K8R41_00845 [Bacteroidales bacterium]|nr:hypothetical protein [Bacteroidales bacterium]